LSSIPGHTEDLKNGTCGLVVDVGGWLPGNSSCAVLPLTRHSAAFTAKGAAWPPAQASGNGHRRPLVTLRNEYRN